MVKCILPLCKEIPYIFSGNHMKGLRFRGLPRNSLHHPHPFPEIKDMGRSIQTYLLTTRCKSRSKHIRHRSLAVGACYMNDTVAPVWMPHHLVHELHIGNAWLVGRCSCLLKRWEPHEEFLYHFVIFFFSKFHFLTQKRLLNAQIYLFLPN